jgi:hypothetical protein
MKRSIHQWLFIHVKWVSFILALFIIFTVVAYSNQDWALTRNIISYFEFWQQPFVALSTVFIAYTAWVALGYVIKQHDSNISKD